MPNRERFEHELEQLNANILLMMAKYAKAFTEVMYRHCHDLTRRSTFLARETFTLD